MEKTTEHKQSFMMSVATFIVDKRSLFFLLTIVALIFSAFSRNWVEVENDLTQYLPDDSETRQALDIMNSEFITYGTAEVMVANITYDDAETLSKELAGLKGVQSVTFDDTTDHYNSVSALYSITFDYDENDDACLTALHTVKDYLSGQDVYISTDLGNTKADIIAQEISVIMVYVAVIVVTVLLLTSRTFGEVPVLLITFVTAMILNQGSSFLLGKISFVSNSVTSILQLALSLDYAVILVNRFKEEHQTLPIREAAIVALSKAIPEICASSLTTIGGLFAMIFMQFKIGADMAVNLIKAILFALLSVFIVMPGLLVLFGPVIDKTGHRNLVPKITPVGKYAWATRHVVPAVFAVLVAVCIVASQHCPYVYGYSTIKTPKLNDVQIAENMISENFTSSNMVALVIPKGDYETEAELLDELDSRDEIDYTMGLANIEAMDGYMLADALTPREFAEMANIDYETAEVAYAAYAVDRDEYGELAGTLAAYKVPLIDMLLFVCDKIDEGIITLDEEQTNLLESAKTQMEAARAQLEGENYARVLVYLNLPVSGDETYAFLDTLRSIAEKYYPDGNVYVAGDSTSEYDFEKSFSVDNIVVSVVSILIVLVVLLFTFNSAGMPILLILVIQGSIWMNFSIPVLTQTPLFFMGYLVVSSIQMGANIDYAIVIASRYQELKTKMDHREAMIETLNFAFPTIITSGTILMVSGFLIGRMTSEATIVGIGESLGRGTVISMILVLFVLPQILLLGGTIIDKTSFSVPKISRKLSGSGTVFIDGVVTGEVHGTVSGYIRGFIDGETNLNLLAGSQKDREAETAPKSEETEKPKDGTAEAGSEKTPVMSAVPEAGEPSGTAETDEKDERLKADGLSEKTDRGDMWENLKKKHRDMKSKEKEADEE